MKRKRQTGTFLRAILILAPLLLLACEVEDPCNDIQCDADCRNEGHPFGECRNGECVCGSCDEAACRAECIAAGFASGSCVAGACNCSNNCSRMEDCPESKICHLEECKDPWGLEYAFIIVNGDFPERSWEDGGEWDFGGSCPDTYVELTVGSQSCTTPQRDDTCHPEWNKQCNFVLHADSLLSWEMYDEDTLDYSLIAYIEPTVLDVATIRAGVMQWTIDFEGTTYIIMNMEIAPR